MLYSMRSLNGFGFAWIRMHGEGVGICLGGRWAFTCCERAIWIGLMMTGEWSSVHRYIYMSMERRRDSRVARLVGHGTST